MSGNSGGKRGQHIKKCFVVVVKILLIGQHTRKSSL